MLWKDLAGVEGWTSDAREQLGSPAPSAFLLPGTSDREAAAEAVLSLLEAPDLGTLVHFQSLALPRDRERDRLTEVIRASVPSHASAPLDGPDPAPLGPFAPLRSILLDRDPVLVVLNGADRILADPEIRESLLALWATARTSALPLRVLLHATSESGADRIAELVPELAIRNLPPPPAFTLKAVARALPNWSAVRVITARAVLGSRWQTWRHVDPKASLSANIRRLFLEVGGPAWDLGLHESSGVGTRPERYADILAVLAEGGRGWGEISRASAGEGGSAKLGPYMSALEEGGWIRRRTSLDASPKSRRARYEVRDDALAFWFSRIMPVREQLLTRGAGSESWRSLVQPHVRSFVTTRLNALVQHELAHTDLLGSRARQVGGLWGKGYELPISGTLESGGVFYGRCWWDQRPRPETLEEMASEMRETRYGFGREQRLRLLFVRLDADHDWERRVARTRDARFLGPEELVGRSAEG